MKQKGFLQYNKIDSGLSVQRRATRQADEQEQRYEQWTIDYKKRGEDGNRIITVRIREDTLAELDRLAAESNRSRNELISMALRYALDHMELKDEE